ncbi:unnamed protein product [Ranitomeya imitator]|uniref:Glucose transporter 1 n=1 Tax=Ranitomeya imitator TaxID=111125 RepID=A0ABN9MC15_9NEOB|nr:unnamed protein product [Ranitomeya imitator]
MGFSRIAGSPEMVIFGRFITGIHSAEKTGASKATYVPGSVTPVCQDEWAQIPTNYCEKLVEGYPKCLTQVIQFKGISLSVVPMYLGEISPKNLRGFLGLMPSLFICLGVFTAQVLGLPELLGQDEYWPLFLSLIVVPTLIQVSMLPFFPESPRYLLIDKGNVHATIDGHEEVLPRCSVADTAFTYTKFFDFLHP